MSLVEEYYELHEAEAVPLFWKILHILFYGLAGISGLLCGFLLGNLRLKFDDRCYLFTDVGSSATDDRTDWNIINWESDTWCDYYQFSMVSSFIVGIIWGTLFLMCGKGGKSLTGLPQPWRIVWPSLIFNFIYFIIILCSAIGIHRGTNYFCAPHKFDKKGCEPVKLLIQVNLESILLQIEMVVKSSWTCLGLWFILFLLSLFRIVFIVDFHMYKICVFRIDDTVQNKKEEVLRITNYEEPKKLYFETYTDEKIPSQENILEDSEESGTRKKTKADKKSVRQSETSPRLSHKSNPLSYNTVDLRTLKRDKNRKSSKLLDVAFGINRAYLGIGLGSCFKTRSNKEVSRKSRVPTFLWHYAPELCKDGGAGSSSTIQRPDFNEDGSDSRSSSEVPVDFDSDPFLIFKKRI